MKKFKLLSLIAIFCTFMAKSDAQIDATINPVGLLFGNFNVGADFGISDNLSVEAAIGYSAGDLGDQEWSSFPVTAIGKYYVSPNHGADKFYVDAFLRFVSRKYDAGVSFGGSKSTRMGVGFGLGYKVVGNSGFVFDIGVGAGRSIVDNITYDVDGETYDLDWTNIMFNGKLGIGYRFGGK